MKEKFRSLMDNTMIRTDKFGHTIPGNRKLMDTIVDSSHLIVEGVIQWKDRHTEDLQTATPSSGIPHFPPPTARNRLAR
ncbi:hypothetical protein DSO57_1028555 [Entomophthora muscae]|uniref:Uncharacterized protein n=1 Tax=Entomophthora muscae TaxID=34485 RepID=A0ACC2UAV5_9FUNG|nr:hypothetical protein DSO57_1028555 [Entomophthora muscae]